jgi:hypothetical protein
MQPHSRRSSEANPDGDGGAARATYIGRYAEKLDAAPPEAYNYRLCPESRSGPVSRCVALQKSEY